MDMQTSARIANIDRIEQRVRRQYRLYDRRAKAAGLLMIILLGGSAAMIAVLSAFSDAQLSVDPFFVMSSFWMLLALLFYGLQQRARRDHAVTLLARDERE